MPLHFPDRVLAVCGICTPFTPPTPKYIPLKDVVKILPQFSYQYYIDEKTDEAAEFLENHLYDFFQVIYRKSDELLPFFKDGKFFIPKYDKNTILTEKEIEFYVNSYKGRVRDSLNWYKTRELNWNDEIKLSKTIYHPSLMITCGKDPVLPKSMSLGMEKYILNLSRGHIEDASHWVLLEQPEKVNQILKDWLNKICFKSKI